MVVVTTFVVSLLTGGLGIYAGALLVVGSKDYVNAIVTGLIGAVVWILGGVLFGWVPLLGPLLVFLVYAWLVTRRYSVAWRDAAKIAGVAWFVTVSVLVVLSAIGIATVETVGFPSV